MIYSIDIIDAFSLIITMIFSNQIIVIIHQLIHHYILTSFFMKYYRFRLYFFYKEYLVLMEFLFDYKNVYLLILNHYQTLLYLYHTIPIYLNLIMLY